MSKQTWQYLDDATGGQHGEMICTACRRPITEGAYRVRETAVAYVPQHRTCSADDPHWAALDRKPAKHLADRRGRLAAYLAFRDRGSESVLDKEIEGSQAYVVTQG